MALEISECTAASIEFPEETKPTEWVAKIPRGLSAVPDCFELPPKAPKPNFLERALLNATLILVHLTTWTIQVSNWVLKTFFGYSSHQNCLYRQLHQIASTGILENIEDFLYEHAEDGTAAGFLFGEFRDLPELYFHLPEILKGANVCLYNDKGFFCSRWKGHADAYQRLSSHRYQGKECYAIGHFLFWLDHEGHTRFQFEKTPLKGFFSSLNHVIDYIRYKRDNEQQGVAGESGYTEHYCLKFNIDLENFQNRKNQ